MKDTTEKKERTQAEKIEALTMFLEHSPELTDLLFDILNEGPYMSKDKMLEICGINSRKVDSAYPINYYRRIEEIYPGIQQGTLCYNYNDATHGELLNINDVFVEKLLKTIREAYS